MSNVVNFTKLENGVKMIYSTDIAEFKQILNEFMTSQAVNMITAIKDKEGNIVIHGSDNGVELVDCWMEDN